ncbi:MAG: hypothetical protein MI867_27590 [Pseudomonadales bacterium]|nr:hypothetical protein [Pseudomonadales bacterium]
MAEYHSNYFNSIQLTSLQRIGNLYMPGNGNMPSFSETACLEHVDVVLDEIDPGDRSLLGLLLLALRWVPLFLIEILLKQMDQHHRYPELLAGPLRLMSLALKGISMSLYYSGMQGAQSQGASVFSVMDYSLHCEPDSADSKSSSKVE